MLRFIFENTSDSPLEASVVINPAAPLARVRKLPNVRSVYLTSPSVALIEAIPAGIKEYHLRGDIDPEVMELISDKIAKQLSLDPLVANPNLKIIFTDVHGELKKKIRLLKQTHPTANIECQLSEYADSGELRERAYEAEVADLTEQLNEARSTFTVLTTRNDQLATALFDRSVQDEQNTALSEALKIEQQRNSELATTLSDQIADANLNNQIILNLEEQVKNSKDDLSAFKAANDASIAEFNKAQETIAGLTAKVAALQKDKEQKEKLEQTTAALTAEVTTLQASNATLKAESEATTSALRAEITALKDDKEVLKSKARDDARALNVEISALRREKDSLKRKAEDTADAHSAEVAALTKEKDDVKARAEKAATDFNFEKAKYGAAQERMISNNLALNNTNNLYKAQIEELKKNLPNVEAAKKELEESKKKARVAEEALNHHRQISEVQAQNAAKRISELEAALRQSHLQLAQSEFRRLNQPATPTLPGQPIAATQEQPATPINRGQKTASPNSPETPTNSKRAKATPAPTAPASPAPSLSSQGFFALTETPRTLTRRGEIASSLLELSRTPTP